MLMMKEVWYLFIVLEGIHVCKNLIGTACFEECKRYSWDFGDNRKYQMLPHPGLDFTSCSVQQTQGCSAMHNLLVFVTFSNKANEINQRCTYGLEEIIIKIAPTVVHSLLFSLPEFIWLSFWPSVHYLHIYLKWERCFPLSSVYPYIRSRSSWKTWVLSPLVVFPPLKNVLGCFCIKEDVSPFACILSPVFCSETNQFYLPWVK